MKIEEIKERKARHPRYGECTVISIHDGYAIIGVDTEDEAAKDAEDQSVCYGMDYYQVPLESLSTL